MTSIVEIVHQAIESLVPYIEYQQHLNSVVIQREERIEHDLSRSCIIIADHDHEDSSPFGERTLCLERPDSALDHCSDGVGQDSYEVNILSSPSQRENSRSGIIDHTYRDFSGFGPTKQDTERYQKVEQSRRSLIRREQRTSRNINAVKKILNEKRFPSLLHFLLSLDEDFGDIITWLPHGRSFVVRDKQRFIANVASSYFFKFTKYESFVRQINGWGFKRITQGPDINSYYHELFLKGMPHLVKWMKRSSAASLGGRSKGGRPLSRPCDEPNFYEISAKYPIPDHYNTGGQGRPILMRELRRSGGYFYGASHTHSSILHHRQNQANVNPHNHGPLALESQRDSGIKDESENKNDFIVDTTYSWSHKEDCSLLDESYEQDLQAPSELDWESLWDALTSDAGGNNIK